MLNPCSTAAMSDGGESDDAAELLDEEDDPLPDDLTELNEAFIAEILKYSDLEGDALTGKEDELRIMLSTVAFVFNDEDKAGSGSISVDDLSSLLERIGRKRLSREDMFELLARVDSDPTGVVRYREFVNIMLLERGEVTEPVETLSVDLPSVRRATFWHGHGGVLGGIGDAIGAIGEAIGGVMELGHLGGGGGVGGIRARKRNRGHIRLSIHCDGPGIRITAHEAQGIHAPVRGLPSPFVKCHLGIESADDGRGHGGRALPGRTNDLGPSVRTKTARATANPSWKEELVIKKPLEKKRGVRLFVSVMHHESTMIGAKDMHIGSLSFSVADIEACGCEGWYKLLNERQGAQLAIPLKKIRISHRVVSTTEERPARLDDFVFGRVLGEGAYGKVYLVQDKDTKEVHAAKIMPKLAIVQEDHDMALVERRVLTMQPPSPFVARLYAAFQSEAHVFLVMEFFHGGDLEGHLKQDGERKMFTPEVVRHVTAQVGMGLWYLHGNGCMYRDLKPANVMIDSHGVCKLNDFGLSKCGLVGDAAKTETFVGTPNYMAPEVVRFGSEYAAANGGAGGGDSAAPPVPYGFEVDFWSLGVMVKEMITGRGPWEGAEQRGTQMIFQKIVHEPIVLGPLPRGLRRDWCKKTRKLLAGLLERNPAKRLCSERAIKSAEFFKGFKWEGLELTEPPGRVFVPDLDKFYFVAEGDGKVKLSSVDSEDFEDIKHHAEFFAGFDFIPGTVEEQRYDDDNE